MKIVVYTDGACKGNPGSGGWAYVCLFNGKPHMIVSGHKDDTTNNCMELTAICKALNYIKKNIMVYIILILSISLFVQILRIA